ncbi:MAG: UPF0317 protein YcsI [Planctomycetaceae bacterium]|nr:MAG: UPF0317 protein YcsI [Planctomycetaceae bacterium]
MILPADRRRISESSVAEPQACPLLDVTTPGDPVPSRIAPSADIRSDLPRFRVWEHGKVIDEPTDVTASGGRALCRFPDRLLVHFRGGAAQGGWKSAPGMETNVPMYRTWVECIRPGFPWQPGGLDAALRAGRRGPRGRDHFAFPRGPRVPGSRGPARPAGNRGSGPSRLRGRRSIDKNELPVFWACGVTPQAVLEEAAVPFAITHAPGCMFVSDVRDEDLGSGGFFSSDV